MNENKMKISGRPVLFYDDLSISKVFNVLRLICERLVVSLVAAISSIHNIMIK